MLARQRPYMCFFSIQPVFYQIRLIEYMNLVDIERRTKHITSTTMNQSLCIFKIYGAKEGNQVMKFPS